MSPSSQPTVLHVAAECDPIAKVGGLAEAVAGLSRSMSVLGWSSEVVLPDYGEFHLDDQRVEVVHVPSWCEDCWVRTGVVDDVGRVALIGSTSLRRPHPYVDPSTSESWKDNACRFFTFAAGAAAFVALRQPDVVHVHDWHGAAATCLVGSDQPIVLTIHNLAHQGAAPAGWIDRIGPRAEPMRLQDACVPLAGAVRRADAVVTVSDAYRREICAAADAGVGAMLAERADRFSGILNGIDPSAWNPSTDVRIPFAYSATDLRGKRACRGRLLNRLARPGRTGPVVVVVSRMAHQKGIDLAVSAAARIASDDGLLVIHGAGQFDVCETARAMASRDPEHVVVLEGFDLTTSHRLIAGADMLLMPSRFEPCGLTQLQAMTYGTIPIVTDVGGLRETVIDADRDGDCGSGFVARVPSAASVAGAIDRAIHAWNQNDRWTRIQQTAMRRDWTWAAPAAAYAGVYRSVLLDGSRLSGRSRRHQPSGLGDCRAGRGRSTRRSGSHRSASIEDRDSLLVGHLADDRDPEQGSK